MMISRPIRAQSAPLAGSPSNNEGYLDIQRTLLEVWAAHDRLVQSLSTRELDQHKDRLKTRFEARQKTLHTRLAALMGELTAIREQLCRQTRLDDAQAKELRKTLRVQLERLARLGESVTRAEASREQCKNRELELMAQRQAIKTSLTEARKSRDQVSAGSSQASKLAIVDRFLRAADRATNPRTTRDIQTAIRHLVQAWRDAHLATAPVMRPLTELDTVKCLTELLKEDAIVHALGSADSQAREHSALKIIEALGKAMQSRLTPQPSMTPTVICLAIGAIMAVTMLLALRHSDLLIPNQTDISEVLVWLENAFEFSERIATVQKAGIDVSHLHAATEEHLFTATRLVADYQDGFASQDGLRHWLQEATQLHQNMLSQADYEDIISLPKSLGALLLGQIDRLGTAFLQTLFSDETKAASERIQNTLRRRELGLTVFRLLEVVWLMVCIVLGRMLWRVRSRQHTYRLAERNLRPLAEQIVTAHRRTESVHTLQAEGPTVRKILRQSTHTERPLETSTTRRSAIATLQALRQQLDAEYQRVQRPAEAAIQAQHMRLGQINTQLSEQAEKLDKLNALLPKKLDERNRLTQAVRTTEDALLNRARHETTSRAARDSLALGLETEILQTTLEQEKTAYLSALETLRQQYQGCNEEVERYQRELAELESSGSFDAARRHASRHILATALDRARERHVGLDLAALESRVKQGEFTGESGRVTTAPVERASSYYREAHLLMAVIDATHQAPSHAEFRAGAGEIEKLVRHTRPLGVVLAIDDTGNPVSFEAMNSRVSFRLGQDGALRITHIHPER